MKEIPDCQEGEIPRSIDISDKDVYDAMKEITGYLDITPGDFKEIYRRAYEHAVQRLTRNLIARDVMTQKVISVKRDALLAEVAKTFGDAGISGAPVVDPDETVVGVLSEKDFLRHMGAPQDKITFMRVVAECLKGTGSVALPVRGRTAGDIMTSPAVTVAEDTPIMGISEIFTKRKINRVPVVDHDGKLVGIVTRTDILRHSCPGQ